MIDRVRIEGIESIDVGFTPRPMVRWLAPRGLAVTGFQLLVAALLGAYIDKRELQASFPDPEITVLSGEDSLWLDFLADTGDGFNPTYAVARAIAEPKLDLRHGSNRYLTERGRALILGGDIAYPVAHRAEYGDRFIGPFRAALPATDHDQRPPWLLAAAGNHDWYDSLTTFLRVFTEGSPIGGWQTLQTRSYFAAPLPHRWHLMSVDLAFDYFIDGPQLAFFRRYASAKTRPGDQVLLVVHAPYWLIGPLKNEPFIHSPSSLSNLERFEEEIIRSHDLHEPLVLAGDYHHYNRYTRPGGSQHRIVSGSGGTFIYPTHHLPARLYWPESDGIATYERKAAYPDAPTSRRLRWGTIVAPVNNPSFVGFVAVVYLFFAIMMRFDVAAGTGAAFQANIDHYTFPTFVAAFADNPLALFPAILLAGGFAAFADARSWPGRGLVGLLHGLAQVAALLAVIWGSARILPPLGPVTFAAVYGALCLVVGGIVGSFLTCLYLTVMQVVFHKHPTHSFSAQHLQDHRSFLRLHFEEDGALTIYPVGIEHVPRRWRYVRERGATDAWFEPVDRAVRCHLIEEPIRVRPPARPTRHSASPG